MKHIWDVEELATHWSLSFEEMQLLKSKPARNHLPLVVQLKYYQYTGRFSWRRRRYPTQDTPLLRRPGRRGCQPNKGPRLVRTYWHPTQAGDPPISGCQARIC